MINIEYIAVENLRSYTSTKLDIKNLTVLVGENNEGKSSLLKMLTRFMSIEENFWIGRPLDLNDQEIEFWYPANEAKHKARRFTIGVKFLDGRTARGFNLKKGETTKLRFGIDSTGKCRLNLGDPRRNEVHDKKALELFKVIKREIKIFFIPPIRDGKSSDFAKKITRDVNESLKEKILHNKQAGSPIEYRKTKAAIDAIKAIVKLHSKELSKSNSSPLAAMLRASEVRVELFPKDIFELIERSIAIHLSTGAHDSLKVLPWEVGNGLQSLIDINLTIESLPKLNDSKQVIVIIEEPEAFLHPSAQRQFMQYLRFSMAQKGFSTILTTHSPIILDESRYEEIVLVRNQKHYPPTTTDPTRASINNTLMTVATSEIFFARTIVLVEGEGDRALLNTIFRKIKNISPSLPELTGLVFQPTGGNTNYAPWLKLLNSYKNLNDSPFNYFWIMDGDSANKSSGKRPLVRCIHDNDLKLNGADLAHIESFGNLGWAITERSFGCNLSVNQAIDRFNGHLFCCDLEWALFNGSSNKIIEQIKAALVIAEVSFDDQNINLPRLLGSKIDNGKSREDGIKNPSVRVLIAENLELNKLPPEIFEVVHKILLKCFNDDTAKVNSLISKCKISR
ncbi:AAA family ATPase [Polynucleobacter sp. Ross1-W9]|uniref:ATP-dependent nuclease n=1 Tax=Polynucleobacter parvulilacunae TaxID=1855631 RepID=UPI001C0BC234|nr:AAA family ATPase [Polynucleobacter parvulilacunae]MBU3557197.1 AAA family ATPase [Polynucleobacter parvulilacunae]